MKEQINPTLSFIHWNNNFNERADPTLSDMEKIILPSCRKLLSTRSTELRRKPKEILVGINEPHNYTYRVFYDTSFGCNSRDYTQKQVDKRSR